MLVVADCIEYNQVQNPTHVKLRPASGTGASCCWWAMTRLDLAPATTTRRLARILNVCAGEHESLGVVCCVLCVVVLCWCWSATAGALLVREKSLCAVAVSQRAICFRVKIVPGKVIPSPSGWHRCTSVQGVAYKSIKIGIQKSPTGRSSSDPATQSTGCNSCCNPSQPASQTTTQLHHQHLRQSKHRNTTTTTTTTTTFNIQHSTFTSHTLLNPLPSPNFDSLHVNIA
jgi:hypothetical protein